MTALPARARVAGARLWQRRTLALDRAAADLDHRPVAIVTRADHEAALATLAASIREPREGILGPRSVAWRLGGDLSIFMGGGRAVLLQLAHPMVAFAIEQHSRTRRDVVGRFQRTFRNVFAMVFGDLDDALAAARRVHAVHARISGTIPHALGRWAAGTAYHANDADALRWVHATLVDTTLVVRESLDGALPAAQKDAYVVEMNRFAALFGIPPDRLPTSHAAHHAYMQAMLAGDQLAVAPCAREMAMFLVGRGEQAHQTPLGRLVETVTATLLPERFVHAFGLQPARVSARAARLALRAIGPMSRCAPRGMIALPAHAEARRRLVGLPPSRWSAWTERQLFGLTRSVTGS